MRAAAQLRRFGSTASSSPKAWTSADVTPGAQKRRIPDVSKPPPLHRDVKKVTCLVKAGLALCGGLLGSLTVADPVYVMWKASRCDLPEFKEVVSVPRDKEVTQLTDLMDSNIKSFVVVSGTPGVGKTTAVLNAAKKRKGGVLYLNAATVPTLDKVLDEMAVKYASLWDFKRDPDPWKILTRAADWHYWWYNKELVVIIDHIDRVEGAEQLLHYAKEAADVGKLRFVFIASGEVPDLRKTSVYCTRAMELRLDPPPATSVKELLANVFSSKPLTAGQVDEIVYLSGCNLSDVWYYVDGLRLGYNMQQLQGLKDYNISFSSWGCKEDEKTEEELRFWKRLLEAGPSGIKMSPYSAKLAALGSNNCFRIEADRVFFRDGVCRDFYARLLKFKVPVRKYEAYTCNASTRVERRLFGKFRVLHGKKIEQLHAEECFQK